MPPKKKKTVDLKQKRVDTMLNAKSNAAKEDNKEAPTSSSKPPKRHDNSDFPVNFETFYANTNVRDFAIEEIKYQRKANYEKFLTDDWIKKMARGFYKAYYTLKRNRQVKPLDSLRISPQCPAEIRDAIASFPLDEKKKALKGHISKQIVDSTKAIQSHIERFPLTFAAFKKFTFWEEIIDVILDYYTDGDMAKYTAIRDDKGRCEQIIHNYYYRYYARPEVREHFHIRFKAVPANLKEKLLRVPAETELNGEGSSEEKKSPPKDSPSNHHRPGDVAANATENTTPPKNSSLQAKRPGETKVDSLLDRRYTESKNIVETTELCERTMAKFPVTLTVFRNSTDWRDTVKTIIGKYVNFDHDKFAEYRDNEEECQRILRNLYYHFYTRPHIRDMFPLRLKPMPALSKVKLLSIPMLAAEEGEEDPKKRIADDDAASTKSKPNDIHSPCFTLPRQFAHRPGCETSSSVYVTAPSSEFNDSHDTRMETPPGEADEAPLASPSALGHKARNNQRSRQSSGGTDAANDRPQSAEPERVQIQSVQVIVPPKDVAASQAQSAKATDQKTSSVGPKQPGQVASPEKLAVLTPGFLSNRRSVASPNRRSIAAVVPATKKSPTEAGEEQEDETADDDVLELDEDIIRQWDSEEQENLEDCPHLWPSILTFAKGYQNPATWPYLIKGTIEPNTKENSSEHAKSDETAAAALAVAKSPILPSEAIRRQQVDATCNQMVTTSIQIDTTCNQMATTCNQMDATSKQMDATSNQMDATCIQVDATSYQMDATSIQVDATSNQMASTSIQVASTSIQVDATSNQMDATNIQIDATSNQMDATSSQMDATSNQMDATSIQEAVTSTQLVVTVKKERRQRQCDLLEAELKQILGYESPVMQQDTLMNECVETKEFVNPMDTPQPECDETQVFVQPMDTLDQSEKNTQNPLERTQIPEQSNVFTEIPSHFVSFANTQMQLAALPNESLPAGDPLVSPKQQNVNAEIVAAATPIKTEKAEKPLKNMKFVLDEAEDTFVCEPIRESEEIISILDETREHINLTDELMRVPSTLNNA